MLAEGKISAQDYQKYVKESATEPLEAGFKRLTLQQMEHVFEAGTRAEQFRLLPIITQKRAKDAVTQAQAAAFPSRN